MTSNRIAKRITLVAVSEPDLDNVVRWTHSLPFFLSNVAHFEEMDPDSYTSNSLVERELRGRLSEAEGANNTLRRLLSRAEEEVEIVRSLSEKFRRLLSEAEAKNLQEKLAYLDLENNYVGERMMRMNLVS